MLEEGAELWVVAYIQTCLRPGLSLCVDDADRSPSPSYDDLPTVAKGQSLIFLLHEILHSSQEIFRLHPLVELNGKRSPIGTLLLNAVLVLLLLGPHHRVHTI